MDRLMKNSQYDLDEPSSLARRLLLKYGISLFAAAPLGLVAQKLSATESGPESAWPQYLLRRSRDELYIRLTAVGFRENRFLGCRSLVPTGGKSDQYLVFTLPPQHFAETAIGVTEIPTVFTEDQLRTIQLTPSAPSDIVFRVKNPRHIKLTLSELLDWQQFTLVLPDLRGSAEFYDLDVPDSTSAPFTRLEIPWGINLSPATDKADSAFTFTRTTEIRSSDSWLELWTTSLAHTANGPTQPIDLEVLAVRGFNKTGQSGSLADENLTVNYEDKNGVRFPPDPTPISNYNRIQIATSLSRRFPYTGKASPLTNSTVIDYKATPASPDECVNACYAEGRTISASVFSLSARGGWLQLDGKWEPFPGCALSGWLQTTSIGRDQHAEIVNEGFLFPFCVPCQVAIISDRVFSKDEDGHYISPIIKQAFLKVPQPNAIEIGHVESPFRYISVTTKESPPLDLPKSGDPDEYSHYDFFVPRVKGMPFSFEHVGTDWVGDQHRSSTPLYFVSNKARLANGLIWEPGLIIPPHSDLMCETKSAQSDPDHTIERVHDGLRVVDKLWALEPGRFASYGGTAMELASSDVKGQTAQKVDWVEWTRGNIPDLTPTSAVKNPFRPRARSMRIQIQGVGQLSGEKSGSIATYRDVRFTDAPILDPEPTTPPLQYFANVARSRDPDAAYLFVLDTRVLITQPGKVSPRTDDQVAQDIRQSYFNVSVNPTPIPSSLFSGIDNEIRFGHASSSEGVGGLSVPDTHINILTRKHGVVGDATFNEGRWNGYSDAVRIKLQSVGRLDYAAFAQARHRALDVAPFDTSRTDSDRAALATAARDVMHFTPPIAPLGALDNSNAADKSGVSPGVNLGDLFGGGAQIIPGLSFADVFKEIALSTSDDHVDGAPAAAPLVWNTKLSGIEWLSSLLNGGTQMSALPAILAALRSTAIEDADAEPLSLGMEASLHWTNTVFKDVTIGPAEFIPETGTAMTINATARIDLGVVSIPINGSDFQFSPGKSKLSAKAELSKFAVKIFGAIQIHFSNVAFEIAADGNKTFSSVIDGVKLLDPLDFIAQLASVFKGLGSDTGIHVDLSPERIRISQTLRFPAKEGDPLYMGPAQIINLALSWSVTIPLRGRDVLSVGFGVSSREKPLTIYIPPWYGGKAYALIEATTKGCRIVEISMEYGALIPIHWGIAAGQASLTAGIFFMLERLADDSATVTFRAFVKAMADLSVAGIIQFAGLIYIALSYKSSPHLKIMRGEATVSVSIKIGFVRISYSFTAAHEEVSNDQSSAFSQVKGPLFAFNGALPRAATECSEPSQISGNAIVEASPFGPAFSAERRAAFNRIIAAYGGH
jgi:hypothetical protein